MIASVALSLIALASFGSADTLVSGTITTTTWTKPNSPYHVTDTVRVPAGNTLTIGPGVDVLFDANVTFVVNGSIQANGTASDSIRFLTGVGVGWGGLLISGGDSSSLAYTRVSGVVAPALWATGAISVVGSQLSLSNVVVSGNVLDPRPPGDIFYVECSGGLYVADSARAWLTDCTFRDNASYLGGAMFVGGGSSATLERCLLRHNHALQGGGIYATDAHVTMTRCVVAGNSTRSDAFGAYFGPGVCVTGAAASLEAVNCVISYNSGGGCGLDVMDSASATLVNCIVWADCIGRAYNDAGAFSVTYSDVAGSRWESPVLPGWPGEGNINADPLFVSPPNGDYTLQAGSPCIDAGDPTSPLDPHGSRADMGAFRYDPVLAVKGGDRPVSFALWQNYPNPFNPTTTLRFSLPEAGRVTLAIYDVNGRLVRTLVDGAVEAGTHEVVWNGRDSTGRNLASGVYLYRLTSEQGISVRKMVLVR